MSMWTFSRNLRLFLIGLPRLGILMDAKSPIVCGSSPPASMEALSDEAMRHQRCNTEESEVGILGPNAVKTGDV
eukprot:scaffold152614_cov80-Cyclotella_meneghiniana.AAC.6